MFGNDGRAFVPSAEYGDHASEHHSHKQLNQFRLLTTTQTETGGKIAATIVVIIATTCARLGANTVFVKPNAVKGSGRS